MRTLKRQGMEMPSERAFGRDHKGGDRCNFEDLLRLVWDPLLVWMESSTSSGTSMLPEAQIA